MKTRSLLFIASIALLAFSCKDKDKQAEGTDITISPSAGYAERDGKPVSAKVSYPASYSPDSVVYFLDSVRVGSKKDSSVMSIKTDTLRMGARVITAKVYKDGKSQDVSTNVVIMPTKMPARYTYKVIKKFPHDTSAYTEGLLYQDGYLYESTGNAGHSDLRKVELETGKVVQRQKLGDQYFGEGSAIVGDKIVMFTYKEKVGFVFDKKTFKPIKQFNNNVGVEGWGVTYDGKKLYLDDSTNRIWFLDPNDYHQIGFIDVFDHESALQKINELEYVDGKVYANLYTYDTIVQIDAKTGAVLQAIDMSNLWPDGDRPKGFDGDNNVLNGIAYDAKGKRFFVTGKKWPYVYQVEFIPIAQALAQ
jgi:glutamine cyclotransferase